MRDASAATAAALAAAAAVASAMLWLSGRRRVCRPLHHDRAPSGQPFAVASLCRHDLLTARAGAAKSWSSQELEQEQQHALHAACRCLLHRSGQKLDPQRWSTGKREEEPGVKRK
jgi:hypothetical protein